MTFKSHSQNNIIHLTEQVNILERKWQQLKEFLVAKKVLIENANSRDAVDNFFLFFHSFIFISHPLTDNAS